LINTIYTYIARTYKRGKKKRFATFYKFVFLQNDIYQRIKELTRQTQQNAKHVLDLMKFEVDLQKSALKKEQVHSIDIKFIFIQKTGTSFKISGQNIYSNSLVFCKILKKASRPDESNIQ